MEEICIDSGFMPDGAPIPDELNSLALVMLWELSERKFILRGSRSKAALGTRIEEVLEVEKYLEKVDFWDWVLLFFKIFCSVCSEISCILGSITHPRIIPISCLYNGYRYS